MMAAPVPPGNPPFAELLSWEPRRMLWLARSALARLSVKGPRKANPKYKRRMGQAWTSAEVAQLKSLAKQNTPTGVLSLKLGRPPAAIRSKAQREGISLR